MVYFWLIVVFISGACVGSFLNVCIVRLPLEKSILWPTGSYCFRCLAPIGWQDNIPLLSYWLLRGRCRACGTPFSIRYFVVELLTAVGFTAIFYLVVIDNVHRLPLAGPPVTLEQWIFCSHHALLFCLLLVVSWIDIDQREIPLGVTITGTGLGLLVFSIFFPWPWPWARAPAVMLAPAGPAWFLPPIFQPPPTGLYPWPLCWPLPDWLGGGDWQTGLATGLAGLAVGSLFVRAVRFLFTTGLGIEALGMGDADLMMMAGSFLGWQPIVTAFIIAVIPALLCGLVQLVLSGDNAIPFGPSLAVGVLISCLFWDSIGPWVAPLFANGPLLLALALSGGLLMLVSGFALRLLRRLRGA